MTGAGPHHYYVVVYDIADNRRRYRAVKLLESYGSRIQESAFECNVSDAVMEKLKNKLVRVLDKSEDKLRVYRLTSRNTVFTFGDMPVRTYEPFVLI